ncbi:hypothetical protein [Cryobacterium sp. N19]|uniref:hypothetical protein n=1 Tax=Cryobacterium sp. N19 TaxID=2048288 RepID=UPI001124E9ED|nr:hypothetical protein [Cryobacterium sp. N19]
MLTSRTSIPSANNSRREFRWGLLGLSVGVALVGAIALLVGEQADGPVYRKAAVAVSGIFILFSVMLHAVSDTFKSDAKYVDLVRALAHCFGIVGVTYATVFGFIFFMA